MTYSMQSEWTWSSRTEWISHEEDQWIWSYSPFMKWRRG